MDLPSAPRAAAQPSSGYDPRLGGRGGPSGYGGSFQPTALDQNALPRYPPFVAFVGSLSFDATEEDLRGLFFDTRVKSVRFPPPGDTGPRGFCYVEFETIEGLTAALMKSGQMVAGRPCRIDVSSSKREEREPKAFGNWRGDNQVVEQSDVISRYGPPRVMSRDRPGMAMDAPSGGAPAAHWRGGGQVVERSEAVQPMQRMMTRERSEGAILTTREAASPAPTNWRMNAAPVEAAASPAAGSFASRAPPARPTEMRPIVRSTEAAAASESNATSPRASRPEGGAPRVNPFGSAKPRDNPPAASS